MSTTAPTRQLHLPGQSAAPDGPIDLTPMWVMHHGFRRDLDAFVTAVAATPVEDRGTWRALDARWQLFASVLHHHHSGEDIALWPMLLDRVDAAGDAAGRATLEAMEAEHAEIDPLLQACADGFARLTEAADADARSALAVRVTATRERLARHLAHEETEAMVLVQAHLTEEDWKRLDEVLRRMYSAREMLATVPWAFHRLPQEALRRSLEPVLGVLWRLFLRRPFERRDRAAFRYARP
jgi:hypothetical protein